MYRQLGTDFKLHHMRAVSMLCRYLLPMHGSQQLADGHECHEYCKDGTHWFDCASYTS